MTKRGRPVKYDPATIRDVLKIYTEAKHGERKEIADRLGVAPASLAVMVAGWRKQGHTPADGTSELPDGAAVRGDIPAGRADSDAPF
jgi:hypothetical protein